MREGGAVVTGSLEFAECLPLSISGTVERPRGKFVRLDEERTEKKGVRDTHNRKILSSSVHLLETTQPPTDHRETHAAAWGRSEFLRCGVSHIWIALAETARLRVRRGPCMTAMRARRDDGMRAWRETRAVTVGAGFGGGTNKREFLQKVGKLLSFISLIFF